MLSYITFDFFLSQLAWIILTLPFRSVFSVISIEINQASCDKKKQVLLIKTALND